MFRRALSLACLLACAACAKHPSPHHIDIALVGAAPGSGYSGFVDEAAAGLAACRRRTGAAITLAAPANADDVEPQLVLMATENKSAVFVVGEPIAPVLDRVARRFDGTHFVFIDGDVPNANIESIEFDVRQGSYLAGVLAALVSKTHRVAFVGGARSPVLAPYAEGFSAGVRAADPHATVSFDYVGSFSDTAAGSAAARTLHASGVDTIYVAAGRAGAGVPGNGAAVIAADTDENRTPGVIASMIKDIARAAEDACFDFVSDKPVAGLHVLHDGEGVTLAVAPRLHLSAAQQARYDALRTAAAAR